MDEVSDGSEQQHAGRHRQDVEDGEAGQAHPHRGQCHRRPRVAHPGTHAVCLLAISGKIDMSDYKLSLVQEKCIRCSSPFSSPSASVHLMFLRVVLLLQLFLWNIHLLTEVVKIPDLLDNYLVALLETCRSS